MKNVSLVTSFTKEIEIDELNRIILRVNLWTVVINLGFGKDTGFIVVINIYNSESKVDSSQTILNRLYQ